MVESGQWAEDDEGTVYRNPVQRYLRSGMKILIMYYMSMVSETEGKVRVLLIF